MLGEWRHDNERAELVERIISLDRRARTAERALRDLAETTAPDLLISVYVARIIELEDTLERLNHKMARRT